MVARDKPALNACRNLEEDLVLYYYGELSEGALSNCEAHLKNCEACRASLAEMRSLLPMTAAHDEPPPTFWNDYSREMRQKLDLAADRKPWWQSIAGLFAPIPMPALATGALLLLALALTFGKGFWQPSSPAPVDDTLLEVLPMAERLEFFSDMEILDNLDLLETLGGQGSGTA
ncbi:MAG TPA: zf-HC2 domain-containing protein [Candidatus Binatia bacterium]|nr:zf-HC2 domain-containing protein [Candidatus Binatia bacterium]